MITRFFTTKIIFQRIKLFFLVIIFNSLFVTVSLSNDWWNSILEKPYFIGEGVLKVFIWDIYILKLYSESKKFNKDKALVLEFEYLRNTSKKSVIKASVNELKKVNISNNKLVIWQGYLEQSISDMLKGEKAAIYWEPTGKIIFFVQGGKKVVIQDNEFANAYINIWLGENTERPKLRKKIIGQNE